MIKQDTRRYLLEIHNVQRKKSVISNLESAIQSLADCSRYIDSSSEDIEDQKLRDYLLSIKKNIMTDSGLGAGFDETQESDLIGMLQKVVLGLKKELDGLVGKYDLKRF